MFFMFNIYISTWLLQYLNKSQIAQNLETEVSIFKVFITRISAISVHDMND